MKNRIVTSLCVLCGTVCAVQRASAQGSLTPPGAPAPTMKTLQQVEPRTPITNTTAVTISAPGSYYLTGNITVGSGNAITIVTNNVTLDLNGFTLTSTNPLATGDGIHLSFLGGQASTTILNGHIVGGVGQAGGMYSGSGFSSGIGGTFLNNVRIVGVTVFGCLSNGIAVGAGFNGTVVESCTVWTVGNTGISAGTVSDSIAFNCGVVGISGTTVQNCYADGNVSGIGILATTVQNCDGESIGTGIGINAKTVENSQGSTISGTGILAINAANSYGYTIASGSGTGIVAYSVENSQGTTISGLGISASTAANSYGYASGSGTGLSADIAHNCKGQSVSGTGLVCVVTASECYGITGNAAAVALKVVGTANVCGGQNSGGGTAIQAAIGIGCTTYGGTNSIPPANRFFGTP